MEKAILWIGVPAALASIVSAWDTFTATGLPLKLFVAASGAVLLVAFATRWLARRVGLGQGPSPGATAGMARLKFWGGILALALMCVIAVLWARFLTERFTLRRLDVSANGKSSVLLIAPDLPVDKVVVELPPDQDKACEYKIRSRGEQPPISMNMVDLGTATPKIVVGNFARPQRLEIACAPAREVTVRTPPRTEVFSERETRAVKKSILAAGAFLWLVASLFMWRLSLRAP